MVPPSSMDSTSNDGFLPQHFSLNLISLPPPLTPPPIAITLQRGATSTKKNKPYYSLNLNSFKLSVLIADNLGLFQNLSRSLVMNLKQI